MERDEVNDLITAKTAGPLARIEAAINVVAVKVGYIEEHMKEANHKTAENVKKIEEVRRQVEELERTLPHTTINCPQNETLSELKDFVEDIKNKKNLRKELGDAYVKSKEEKRAELIKVATAISAAVAALALVVNLCFSILNYGKNVQIKQGVNGIEKIENSKQESK